MEDLSLHILDIAENSIDAGASRVEITIIDSPGDDRLTLRISDNGRGMSPETLAAVTDPFFSTKTVRKKRFGLGVPFLAQAAHETGGSFSIDSAQGEGTTVTASFQRGHIDRKPLGDIGATMLALIGGHPEMDFILSLEGNGDNYRFDTADIKRELGDVPINLPGVLQLIKEEINEALGPKEG